MRVKFFLLLLLIGAREIKGQVITFSIDRFQKISYPKTFSNINDALKNDSIHYDEAGTTELDYFISIQDSILTYRFREQSDTLRVVYYAKTDQEGHEIWTKNEGNEEIPLSHYLIGTDPSGNRIFICRWVEGDKIVGWFSPQVNCLTAKKK